MDAHAHHSVRKLVTIAALFVYCVVRFGIIPTAGDEVTMWRAILALTMFVALIVTLRKPPSGYTAFQLLSALLLLVLVTQNAALIL